MTITAAYAPHQVLVAASIGANYVAPYLGRMNDAGRDGMGTIVSMQETVEELKAMRVLVASVARRRAFKTCVKRMRHLYD